MWPKSVTSVEFAIPRGILSLSANMFYSNVAARMWLHTSRWIKKRKKKGAKEERRVSERERKEKKEGEKKDRRKRHAK